MLGDHAMARAGPSIDTIDGIRQDRWFTASIPGRGRARGSSRLPFPGPSEFPVQTLLISTAAVAIAEIGDKTQLLSLILAAKYRRPLPICIGILVATLVNHALAAGFGTLVAGWFSPNTLKWIVALAFIAIAAWTLVQTGLGVRLIQLIEPTFTSRFIAQAPGGTGTRSRHVSRFRPPRVARRRRRPNLLVERWTLFSG
jgi:hypothetical protein